MSISTDLWEHPRVAAAIKEAELITEGWLKAAGIEANSLSPWAERDLADVWGRIDALLALPEADRNAEWERLA